MISICRRLLAGGGAALALLTLLVAAAPASANNDPAPPTHSGQSYAVGLTGMKVLGTTLKAGDLTLPQDVKSAEGGSVHGKVATINLPAGLGSVVVARADVQGGRAQSNAQSEVTEATLLPAGVPMGALPVGALPVGALPVGAAPGVQLPSQVPTGVAVLSARVLTASAAVDCSGTVQSDSSIAKVSILGTPVDLRAGKDSVVEVPIGGQVAARVRINAQSSLVSKGSVSGSVSALVVEFPEDGPLATLVQGTITLSHAEAGVQGCPATGGGRPGPGTSPGIGGGDQPNMPATGVPSDLFSASSPIDRFIEQFFSRFTRSS